MSLSNDDLETYVEKFRSLFYKQNDQKINETDMWSLIENLTKELEMCKEREDCLQKNLAQYLESENVDITTKFVSLREKCNNFETENTNLKTQLSDMQTQSTAEFEMAQNKHYQKLMEVEKQYENEIIHLKEQIESNKKAYEAKESSLYNELQLAQASAALQCDEIESNLQRQIVDANIKLRSAQNTIRALQMEVNNLKNQVTQLQIHSKPSKPEIRFDPLPVTTTRPSSFTCYEEAEAESEDTEIFEECIRNVSTSFNRNSAGLNSSPAVFRGRGVRNKTPAKTVVPSATPVSPPKLKARKRKKLYDPDSFDRMNIPMF